MGLPGGDEKVLKRKENNMADNEKRVRMFTDIPHWEMGDVELDEVADRYAPDLRGEIRGNVDRIVVDSSEVRTDCGVVYAATGDVDHYARINVFHKEAVARIRIQELNEMRKE
jgi:hypothetical protein